MPTIKLNKTVFEELVRKKLPTEELQDRISMLGTDLESIKANEITVEVFPNRPDMLSEQGFARAFSSFIGVKTGLQTYPLKSSGQKVIVDQSVTMRPYTACALVKNIRFDHEKIKSIIQLQEKLSTTHGRKRKKSAYGLYPIDRINFPITYTAKDPSKIFFRPLGFTEEVRADKIEELHHTGKEFKHVAEGWAKYPFFIDSKDKVLSMLPYTNSDDLGKVEESTKDVFIECTGNDFNNVSIALNILVTTLADMGGEIYTLEIVYPDKIIITPDLTPRTMQLDTTYVNKILGIKLEQKQIIALLARMGYGYKENNVLIPAYRADILHPIDLVEDIAIAYGYENFKEVIPNVSTIGEEAPLEIFLSKIREILVGYGLLECKNYHLITKEECTERMNHEEQIIPLQNALGEHNHLRNAVLPSLLKNLAENQHYEYPQNLFEIGRIFRHGESETGIDESESLAVVLCHEKADFTQIRQLLDGLFRELGLSPIIKEIEHSSYIRGRVGEVLSNKEKIGIIGEINPAVLEKWQINMPIVSFEIEIEKIFKML